MVSALWYAYFGASYASYQVPKKKLFFGLCRVRPGETVTVQKAAFV